MAVSDFDVAAGSVMKFTKLKTGHFIEGKKIKIRKANKQPKQPN